jgi:hypothetical protein
VTVLRPGLIRTGPTVVALAAILGACAPSPSSSGLSIALPPQARQAVTSDDEALCNQLTVDLTLREANAAGAEVDRVLLSPVGVCEWTLDDDDILLARGTYRLLARFTAQGAYPGRTACVDLGADPLWVGAYWLEEVAFPFDGSFGGLTEDLFVSRPDDDAVLATIANQLGDSGLSFDLDNDGFDNLSELAGQSNPCVPNQPPRVTLSATPLQVLEGEAITLDVATDEPGGLQHDVALTIAHSNDGFAPDVAEVILRPYAPDEATVPSPLPGQTWSVGVVVTDAVPDRDTAAQWQVTFMPDEPFVGSLFVQAVARQRGGGPSFDGAPDPLTVEVENVLDPVRIVADDGAGALVPVTTLDFAELGATGAPTTLRLQAETQDIGQQISGSLSLVSGPDGMTFGEDVGFLTLTWTPDNAAAATPPEAGHLVELRFVSDAGEESLVTVPARVSPTFNDRPRFVALETTNINLSTQPFDFKRLRFDVRDPDRVGATGTETPPCAVEVWPEGDAACDSACCQGAFTSTTCVPDGELDGDLWHMVATLTPSDDYFTLCGDAPTFVARLTFTDLVASNADPAAAQTIETQASCSSSEEANGCAEHLVLRSGGLAQATIVGGFTGELSPAINGTTQPLIDEGLGVAVLGSNLDPGPSLPTERVIVVVDLNTPPTVLKVLDNTTELRTFQTYLNYVPAAAVDEVNHRVVGYGGLESGNNVFFSLSLLPPYDVTTWPIGDFTAGGCTGSTCGAPPVVDASGTVWAPAGRSGNGTVVRLLADSTFTQIDLGDAVDSGSGTPGSTIVVDEAGGEWLLWPDGVGIAAFELSTWDDPVPNVVVGAGAAFWSDNEVEGYATAHDRSEAYYAYNQSFDGDDMAELIRVRVSGGVVELTDPIVFGPESISNGSFFHRLVLRQPDPGAPPEEAELLITGGGAQDERPMVDVDSWSLLPFPRPASDYEGSGLVELFASPLPDYFVAVVNRTSDPALQGLLHIPWDPAQAPIPQELGVPDSGDIRQTWIMSAPRAGKLVVNFKSVTVFDFAAP